MPWLVGAVTVAVAMVVAVGALPWHRSGAVERTGFALARAADRIGLVDSTPRRLLFVAVMSLPALPALAVLAAAAGRMRLAGLAVAVAGGVALAAAVVVARAGGVAGAGVPVTSVLAVAAIGAGLRIGVGPTPPPSDRSSDRG